MLRSELIAGYVTVLFTACLFVGSVIAIRQQFGIASLAMLLTSVCLIAVSVAACVVLQTSASVERALESFPFDVVAIASQIIFGVSFIVFLAQRPRVKATSRI
jgi:hypothetical protein